MRFHFVVETTITLGCEVEANTIEEAIDAAKAAPTQTFCVDCAQGRVAQWTLNELDCNPAPGASPLVDCDCDESFNHARQLWDRDRKTTDQDEETNDHLGRSNRS